MAKRKQQTESEPTFRPIQVPIPKTSRPLIVSAVETDGAPSPRTTDTNQES